MTTRMDPTAPGAPGDDEMDWSALVAPAPTTAGSVPSGEDDDEDAYESMFGVDDEDDEGEADESEEVPRAASPPGAPSHARTGRKPPIWPEWPKYRANGNACYLDVMRVNRTGRFENIGELPADASLADIILEWGSGVYDVAPRDGNGSLIYPGAEPYRFDVPPDHALLKGNRSAPATGAAAPRATRYGEDTVLGQAFSTLGEQLAAARAAEEERFRRLAASEDRLASRGQALAEEEGRLAETMLRSYRDSEQERHKAHLEVMREEREERRKAELARQAAEREQAATARQQSEGYLTMMGNQLSAQMERARLDEERRARESREAREREDRLNREERERREAREREERAEDRRRRDEEANRAREHSEAMMKLVLAQSQASNPMHSVQTVVGMVAPIAVAAERLGLFDVLKQRLLADPEEKSSTEGWAGVAKEIVGAVSGGLAMAMAAQQPRMIEADDEVDEDGEEADVWEHPSGLLQDSDGNLYHPNDAELTQPLTLQQAAMLEAEIERLRAEHAAAEAGQPVAAAPPAPPATQQEIGGKRNPEAEAANNLAGSIANAGRVTGGPSAFAAAGVKRTLFPDEAEAPAPTPPSNVKRTEPGHDLTTAAGRAAAAGIPPKVAKAARAALRRLLKGLRKDKHPMQRIATVTAMIQENVDTVPAYLKATGLRLAVVEAGAQEAETEEVLDTVRSLPDPLLEIIKHHQIDLT